MQGVCAKASPVHLSAVLDHDVEDLMTSAAELGLEGVMAKKADSRYVIGRRSRSWIKLKLEQSQEVVVGGWRPGAGARSGTFGALLLGIPDGGKLHYVGRVGTALRTGNCGMSWSILSPAWWASRRSRTFPGRMQRVPRG